MRHAISSHLVSAVATPRPAESTRILRLGRCAQAKGRAKINRGHHYCWPGGIPSKSLPRVMPVHYIPFPKRQGCDRVQYIQNFTDQPPGRDACTLEAI